MNETRLAAMWKDTGVNFTQEAVILRHLRGHFGNRAFATLKKVRMLCEGHTEIKVGKAPHSYEKGDAPETLEYSYKCLKTELETQIASKLSCYDLQRTPIERVDIILGGDHGQGAFQFGVKVVIVLKNPHMKTSMPRGSSP